MFELVPSDSGIDLPPYKPVDQWVKELTELAISLGYTKIQPRYHPPYGWQLLDGDREVTYGSLAQVERYLQSK